MMSTEEEVSFGCQEMLFHRRLPDPKGVAGGLPNAGRPEKECMELSSCLTMPGCIAG